MGNVISYPKDSDQPLSDHFHVREFACRGHGCCRESLVDEDLVAFLQKIRQHFGKPVYIHSGYRCDCHNRAVGGAKRSRHMTGQAADISVEGMAPAAVAAYAESIGILGIGLYETAEDGYFVHIDTRPYRSFWYGQKESYRESFGGYSHRVFVTQLQQAIGAATDGIPGPQTLGLCPTLGEKWNRRHPAVLPVQRYLSSLGYGEVGLPDGVAGHRFATAVAHFQQDKGLANTGILEQGGITWQTLLGLKKGENHE